MSRGFLRNKLLCVFFTLSICACTESVSVPAEFVHLYGDLRIAKREYGEASPDGRTARILVLEKYGYSVQRFDSVAKWIQGNPDVWNTFQDLVVAYVDSVAIEAQAIAPKAMNSRTNGGEPAKVRR